MALETTLQVGVAPETIQKVGVALFEKTQQEGVAGMTCCERTPQVGGAEREHSRLLQRRLECVAVAGAGTTVSHHQENRRCLELRHHSNPSAKCIICTVNYKTRSYGLEVTSLERLLHAGGDVHMYT